MIRILLPAFLLVFLLAVLACADPEEVDTGGVILQVEFVNRPFRVSVNSLERLQIPTIDIDNINPNISAATSVLMNVNLNLFEVTFSRADGGTRIPSPFVRRLAGVVPVGGTLTLSNFTVMSVDQFDNPPLSDLLFENGGFDKETGESNIRIFLTFTVFGRTLGGAEVASTPRTETFEFVP